MAPSYKELRKMRSETRIVTLEREGNSRVFLVPQERGAQCGLGAVGNAEWTRVPLRALLERAGLKEDACEVVLEGADRSTPTEKPIPPRPISYARSMPREKAVQREAASARQMNGCRSDESAPATAAGFDRNPIRCRYCTDDPVVGIALARYGDNDVNRLLADAAEARALLSAREDGHREQGVFRISSNSLH